MEQTNLTRSDKDHIWWLERAQVPMPVKVHVDLGCGAGGLGQYLVQNGVGRSIGVDVLDEAKFSQNPEFFQYLKIDLNRADWPEVIRNVLSGDSVDLVTAFDFLEHVDSPWMTLQSIHRMMTSGGYLVLTTPNVMSWERMLKPRSGSGVQDPQHKILMHPYSLKFLLERSGYEIQMLGSPLRKLGRLGWNVPIGGQMLAVARKL